MSVAIIFLVSFLICAVVAVIAFKAMVIIGDGNIWLYIPERIQPYVKRHLSAPDGYKNSSKEKSKNT